MVVAEHAVVLPLFDVGAGVVVQAVDGAERQPRLLRRAPRPLGEGARRRARQTTAPAAANAQQVLLVHDLARQAACLARAQQVQPGRLRVRRVAQVVHAAVHVAHRREVTTQEMRQRGRVGIVECRYRPLRLFLGFGSLAQADVD